MSNRFNIHKEIGEAINNYEEQSATPYISISDSSNMQVESSHFSINNKNSTSIVNNIQNIQNHNTNNNNNLINSNSGFLSLSKSIMNNNINNISHNNNNSGVQISAENLSLSGSNKLQISSNSIILKKNDISKNSIFLSPSTLCNYYQQSNDVTPYKSPLVKNKEEINANENETLSAKEKEKNKLKQINIDLDIIHKKKNSINNNIININNINSISNNKNNNIIINNNNCEITSRSDECELDNNKTLSSQRKYLYDKKTPIKYAKNQLKSGEKNKSSKSNNSKLEKEYSNSNLFENKNKIKEEEKKVNKGINVIQNKNGRNLMDTFEKVGNDKDNDDNLKFFNNNRRQPTEIHVTSEEGKISKNDNNFNIKFIDRLDEDSSFMEKDSNNNKSNNNINNIVDLKENNIIENEKERDAAKNEEKININYNNIKNEKIEIKKDIIINKEITKEKKDSNINIQMKKEDWKKLCIKKVPSQKKDFSTNITELSKNIIKELSRAALIKKKEIRGKRRPTSFTKNIIINFNSFNSIGVNNNNNIDNNIFKTKKNRNILIKKAIKNINDILDKKVSLSAKNKTGNNKMNNNNTIEPTIIRRKIKIPNRIGKKEKPQKEISITGITNNKEKRRHPSSENYNRRATSFSNLKHNINTNLFHNNLISNITSNNKNIHRKVIINNPNNSSSGQRNNNNVNNVNNKEKTNNNITHHPVSNNINNNINHKNNKKKIKPLINKKDNSTINSNSTINTNNSNTNNDKNYQTISVARNGLDIKLRKNFNNIIKKKENKVKILFNHEPNTNINNATNTNSNTINTTNNTNSTTNNTNKNNNLNVQLKKKDDNKVKIIQNFSSYHKIKYKSQIPENINFAETQPKQSNLFGDGFYKKNKKENKKTKSGSNFLIYNNEVKNNTINANNTSLTRQIKFRKLEKLPGDSDSGDVVLND